MVICFKDYFSENAGEYDEYRPKYPPELYKYLSTLSPGHDRAWDCATGTGQSALGLRPYYAEILATDASKTQIEQATRKDGIIYLVSTAERSNIDNQSVDLITVAQAVHWFNIRAFFKEAGRVLKADGVLAIWSYSLLNVRADIDEVIQHLYRQILDGYWPEERKMVEDGYQNIELPFHPIQSPYFEMRTDWTLDQLTGYLSTWSASRIYEQQRGVNPVIKIVDELSRLWGDPQSTLVVKWPLTVKVSIKGG